MLSGEYFQISISLKLVTSCKIIQTSSDLFSYGIFTIMYKSMLMHVYVPHKVSTFCMYIYVCLCDCFFACLFV